MNRSAWVLISLALLVVAQMSWWAYLVMSQQDQIAVLISSPNAIEKASDYKNMIRLEFLFFLIVWSMGIFYAIHSIRKEKALEQERRLFLSQFTHDLKTPLANIQMSLETLKRPNLEENKISTYLERALKATKNLHHQIEKILSFNEKNLQAIKQKFVLKDVIEANIHSLDLNHRVEKQNLDINLYADKESLNILVRNILDNAKKYSNDDSKIRISATESPSETNLVIRDQGIGMTKEEIQEATRSFWRSPRVVDEAIEGSGMGLSISQSLCKKTGMNLSVNSKGSDLGCEVNIRIPKPKGKHD